MKTVFAIAVVWLACPWGRAEDSSLLRLERLIYWSSLATEVKLNGGSWTHLLLIDPPDEGCSGAIAMQNARAMLLSGDPVSADIRRELEVAVADLAARKAAQQQ